MSDAATKGKGNDGNGGGHGKPHKQITILVNNRPVKLENDQATGAQIKAAAGLPETFKLYDHQGAEIGDDQTVELKDGEHFTAISGQDVS
jgi:hypothetical protein